MNGYISNLVAGNDLGAWSSVTQYARKDVCSWGGFNWIALGTNTNISPPNAPWKLFLDPSASTSVTLSDVYPVGCIYTSTVSTNPGTVFGFGTWSAFGAGRVLVGFDSGQTEFDTVEETGGAKTHTLTTPEIPAHVHNQTRLPTSTGGVTSFTVDTSMSGTPATTGVDTGSTGGGGAHNNLQPYIVVYFFKRTA